jgi:hypothetical protein
MANVCPQFQETDLSFDILFNSNWVMLMSCNLIVHRYPHCIIHNILQLFYVLTLVNLDRFSPWFTFNIVVSGASLVLVPPDFRCHRNMSKNSMWKKIRLHRHSWEDVAPPHWTPQILEDSELKCLTREGYWTEPLKIDDKTPRKKSFTVLHRFYHDLLQLEIVIFHN